ncbi:DUF975 family protein [Haploplasma modicum]|uniref:DUF975 family protein n=1 Tax=Haploplasma modicum TaxID=2150 RepID=UPI00214C6A50|nr:DUF975 family protein [Haploplasma modicum]MCR1809210.1 DUF975 family protein [Haploplasma modicum]
MRENKSSSTLRREAREMMKKQGYFNLLIGLLIISLILGLSNFISLLLIGPAMVGLACFYVNGFRKEKVRFEDLFEPATKNFINLLVMGLLKSIFLFLWTLLFIIPGLIKSYSYAMADYIALDNPKLEANDVITKSREMMDGNKLRLFLLHLSFIGWFLLGILTFGIGLIFLAPYIKAAETAFYLNLLGNNEEVVVEDEVEATFY